MNKYNFYLKSKKIYPYYHLLVVLVVSCFLLGSLLDAYSIDAYGFIAVFFEQFLPSFDDSSGLEYVNNLNIK